MTQPPGAATGLAVEPDKRIRPASSAGGGAMEPGLCKRLIGVLRAVYHMLRRGLCRKRLMMDLHLLLGRGKLAGRALRNLVAAHHHHPHHAAAAHHHLVAARSRSRARRGFGAAAAASSGSGSGSDADAAAPGGLSFAHRPGDVEFSCGVTPSPSAPAFARPGRALFPFRIGGRGGRGCDGLDFAEVARALERMHAADEAESSGSGAAGGETPSPQVAGATPSPLLALSLGRSPAGARRLRVTDSPFPDETEGLDVRPDSSFDAFISKFYESLRLQQADATPDNCVRRRG
ncbi:hypothetical protein BS78_03G028400 [Paspalum vaginatum]|nr:hypothetical protein BS78_03G028400 [Paspalum vaginatum]